MRSSLVSRRKAATTLGVSLLGYGMGSQTAWADAQSNAEGARWMEQWMRASRQPVGGLYLGRFADPIYFLIQPIKWVPNPGQNFGEVSVPAGFVSDLTSIPRLFWSLVRPDGVYSYAAIIHDYLYWFQTLPREDCDTIFKLAMEDFGIDEATVTAIYAAVRLGGGQAWADNARLRERGEKRILRVFPQDPRTRWETWKEESANLL